MQQTATPIEPVLHMRVWLARGSVGGLAELSPRTFCTFRRRVVVTAADRLTLADGPPCLEG